MASLASAFRWISFLVANLLKNTRLMANGRFSPPLSLSAYTGHVWRNAMHAFRELNDCYHFIIIIIAIMAILLLLHRRKRKTKLVDNLCIHFHTRPARAKLPPCAHIHSVHKCYLCLTRVRTKTLAVPHTSSFCDVEFLLQIECFTFIFL